MATKKRTRTGAKKGKQTNSTPFLGSEIGVVALFVVAILLFLSNFGFIGFVGSFLKSFQLGLFGVFGYIFPIILFIGGIFKISNVGNIRADIKLIAVLIFLLALCALISIVGSTDLVNTTVGELYTNATLGGLTGGLLAKGASWILGRIGSIILYIAIGIICLVIITEKSFVNFVRMGSTKVATRAKEDLSRFKEDRKVRSEERRALREARRLSYEESRQGSGVDIASTDLSKYKQEVIAKQEEKLSKEVEHLIEHEDMQPVSESKTEDTHSSMHTSKQAEQVGVGISIEKVPVDRASIFTGNIIKPYDMKMEKEEESLDEETLQRANAILARKDEIEVEETCKEESLTEVAIEEDFEDVLDVFLEENIETKLDDVAVDIPAERNIFKTEEGEKRVVTASGKVIESDTESLKKRIEERNAQSERRQIENTVIEKKKVVEKRPYVFPPTSLLKRNESVENAFSDEEFKQTAIKLQQTLHNFSVEVTVTNISCGPVVTRYELHPEQGVKVSKIVALADDIKLSLAASDIRIEAPIPGKSAVGIEVPNKNNVVVYLRDLFETEEFRHANKRIGFAVGKDIGGQPVIADIGTMPHVLIAGATGSGKSVCINTLIMSIIFKYAPDEVKLIMVDPKVVELSVYNGIPHLLIPVVTDPKKAAGALNWAVAEMTDRYKKFAATGVRDLIGYNKKVEEAHTRGEIEGLPEKLPKIVIIIDELADLMMVANNEVEDAIVRLAQLARACGIHLVIATQRPSVNVITGLIKANVPSRIAFAVSSGVDSRTILDGVGAEKLLGKGDMLFSPQGSPKPMRVQGAFVSDDEVQNVVEFLANQGLNAQYDEDTVASIHAAGMESSGVESTEERDDLFIQAGRFIIEREKASIGNLQRAFKIGFNRAARIMDQLCEAGVVGEEQGTKPRQILLTLEEFEELF